MKITKLLIASGLITNLVAQNTTTITTKTTPVDDVKKDLNKICN